MTEKLCGQCTWLHVKHRGVSCHDQGIRDEHTPCKYWRSKQQDLASLQAIHDPNVTLFTWLDGRSYSDAFIICVGAGPWRFTRRQNVQQTALNYLRSRDLSEIQNKIKDWYPFVWQNQIAESMRSYLRTHN